MSGDVLAELARVRAYFQLRAICAAIGADAPVIPARFIRGRTRVEA